MRKVLIGSDVFLADTINYVPCTVKEIQAKIERNAEETFVLFSIPELFFWELGLEYIGNDTIAFGVRT